MELIFKVSSRSPTSSVAGAIASGVRHGQVVILQAIGAGSVNQAVKAVILARAYLESDGLQIICIPTFSDVQIEGRERTALRLVVQTPERSVPPAPWFPP